MAIEKLDINHYFRQMPSMGPLQSPYSADHHCPRLIELCAKGSTISQICAEFKISRKTFNQWRRTHAEFEEAWEMGQECSQAYWEDITQKGALGELPDNFNSDMVKFRMKSQFREDYKDQKEGPVTQTNILITLSNDELNQKIKNKLRCFPDLIPEDRLISDQ